MSPTSPADELRRAVGGLRRAERRRRFPLGVHVGWMGGERVSAEIEWPEPPAYDAALRFDVLDRLLSARGDRAAGTDTNIEVWLTRPGVPELHDVDQAWHAAARHATGAHGLALAGCYVVTRSGWLDVVTGESRVWKRLRL